MPVSGFAAGYGGSVRMRRTAAYLGAVAGFVLATDGQAFAQVLPTLPTLPTLQVGSTQISTSKTLATVTGQVVSAQIIDVIGDVFGQGGTGFAPYDVFAAAGRKGNVYKAPPRRVLTERDWTTWADVRGTGWENHDPSAGLNGNQLNVTGGVARKLTPDFLVGVFGGYEHLKSEVAALSSSITANGGSVGSFAAWRLATNIRLDVALSYARIAYSAAAGSATGSFHGDRWGGMAGLTGNYSMNDFTLEPSVSVFTLWESQNAWTDSLGGAQADRRFSAGRASGGAKLIRPWRSGDTKITPYAGFYGDWRFSSSSAVPAGQPVVGIGDGWSGRATAGVSFAGQGPISVAIGGEYGGIGAAYKVWSGNVRATVKF